MESSYISQKTGKIRSGGKLLRILIFTLIAFAGCLNQAMAQKFNLSDWNVPPPLPPGTTTKGNTTGKAATGKSAVLTLSDIRGVSLPAAPPVQVPVLAAVSTTSPSVNSPGQPTLLDAGAGLPDIPSPDAQDASQLPKQSLHDEVVSSIVDLPIPQEPEMPVFPAEPTASTQTTTAKSFIPLMPGVISLPSPSLPSDDGINPWSSPGIPDNTGFKLMTPADAKPTKSRGKGSEKAKSQLHKN